MVVAAAGSGIVLLGSTIGSNACNRQDKPLMQRLKKLSRQRFCHSLLEPVRDLVGKPEQPQHGNEGCNQHEPERRSDIGQEGQEVKAGRG